MSDDILDAKISIPTASVSEKPKKEKRIKRTKEAQTVALDNDDNKTVEPEQQAEPVVDEQKPVQVQQSVVEDKIKKHKVHNVVNNDVSPMKSCILEQKDRILEIINNANLFKNNYQLLVSNIIPSVNQQLKSYVKNGKKAIIVDIRELVLDSIDWQAQQEKLVQRLKANKYVNISTNCWKHIDKPTATINQFDDDVFTNMILNCSTENVKEFQKYRKLAKSQLDELINDIDTFERELCDYRSEVVKTMMNNINILFDYHFNYVFDVFNKRSSGSSSSSVVIDNKTITLKKSQKEFITSAINALLK